MTTEFGSFGNVTFNQDEYIDSRFSQKLNYVFHNRYNNGVIGQFLGGDGGTFSLNLQVDFASMRQWEQVMVNADKESKNFVLAGNLEGVYYLSAITITTIQIFELYKIEVSAIKK